MIRPANTTWLAVSTVALWALAGCASPPQNADGTRAAEVKVYAPDQLFRGDYEGVRYLWVDTWRSAFWLPHAATEAEGVAGLQAGAARVGANGLINVSCIDQGHFMASSARPPSFVCYGHATRVRNR